MVRKLPFSRAEYRARLAKVQHEMQRREMDLLMVYWPENIYYLTGYHTVGYFGYQVLLVPVAAEPILLVRRIERENVADLTWLEECEVYQDTEDPLDATARMLIDGGWVRLHIGVELDAWFLTTRHFLELQKRLGSFHPMDASQLVNRIRLIKSVQELKYMRAAARAAEASAAAAVKAIQPGVREYEVAAEMHRGLYQAGSTYLGHPPLLGSGPRAARNGVTWSDRVIRANEPVLIEPGGCVERYHAVFVRPIHVGPPRDKRFLQLVDLSLEGFRAALATIRAGVTSCEVDDAGKAPARKAGFGHTALSRGGYSIGIGFPPDWGEGRTQSIKQGDPTVLQANMTFHLTCPLWYEKALVCFSETVRVTETGSEVLTRFPRRLIIVPARATAARRR